MAGSGGVDSSSNPFGNASFITFEMMTTRDDLLLESLTLNNAQTPGLISISHWAEANAAAAAAKPGNWRDITAQLSDADFVQPGAVGWSGLTSARFVFSTAADDRDSTVAFRLAKVCKTMAEPSLCVARRQYAYALHAHKCDCGVCHSCHCKVQAVFDKDVTCAHGACDSCWCSLLASCGCCYEAECAYECGCRACFDTSTAEVCEAAVHYGAGAASPARGAPAGGPVVAVAAAPGTQFAATQVLCRFGAAAAAQGYFIAPDRVACLVPPLAEAAPGADAAQGNITVPVAVALGEGAPAWGEGGAEFTYATCRGDADCGGGGTCGAEDGACACDAMHTGDFCEYTCPTGAGLTQPCSGFGACDFAAESGGAVCYCVEGHTGAGCEQEDLAPVAGGGGSGGGGSSAGTVCGAVAKDGEAVCGGHGVCSSGGACECAAGYWGVKCENRCSDCSRHGLCRPDTGHCVCFSGFSGPKCEVRACPFDCYGHGTCDDGGLCVCAPGWSGQPTMSFVAVNASSYAAIAGVGGALTIAVVRTGSLAANISVSYATIDETAMAGIDYREAHGSLAWPVGDASPRFVDITLLPHPLPEVGEASFVFALAAPQPQQQCQLGGGAAARAAVRLQSDGSGGAVEGAATVRVTFLSGRADVAGATVGAERDVFKGDVVRIIASLLAVPRARLFVASVTAYSGGALIALDILPPLTGAGAAAAEVNAALPSAAVAAALVQAIASPGSELYGHAARVKLAVDPAYEPHVRASSAAASATDGRSRGGHGARTTAIALSLLLAALVGVMAVAFVKRRDLLWRVAARSFHPLPSGGGGGGNEEDIGAGADEFEMTAAGRGGSSELDWRSLR
ncbi:hypothetical protein JKP88DRAFT_352731 [Tribonema minus]|uniref:EGF-like domain-containing protein n=1 Tax=Tribonema minus TaxID=303371 RepID=A0A835ZA05_9STRA|nr:hypothetical protein JKP88DRAFT_352731 [Tribonema minus]